MNEIYNKLKTFGKVKLNELMAKHTTFKIGGPVDFFVIVDDTDKLAKLLTFVNEQGLSYFILGGGSNLLWQDERFEGVVIKVQSSEFRVQDDNIIVTDASVLLSQIVSLAIQNNLTGLEWGVGVPGTVGGAVRGNAGAMGSEIAGCLQKVEVWKDGEVVEFSPEECEFVYRGSFFKKNSDIVILRTYFKLEVGDKAEIMKAMQGYLAQRTGRYPIKPNAGSFFKNLEIDKWTGNTKDLPSIFIERKKVPVGWLVEQCNLKGYAVGGAKVSDEHGNFIINTGDATQSDVLAVIEKVKEEVYNKYGIELEEEVQIINF